MVSLYSRKSQNFQVFLLLFMTRRWYAWNFCLNQDCLYTLLPSSHSTIYCLCSTLADSAANSIELPKFLVYGVIHSLLCNLYLQCSIKWASLDFWQHYSVKNVPIFFDVDTCFCLRNSIWCHLNSIILIVVQFRPKGLLLLPSARNATVKNTRRRKNQCEWLTQCIVMFNYTNTRVIYFIGSESRAEYLMHPHTPMDWSPLHKVEN